jgi:hypothetical protein
MCTQLIKIGRIMRNLKAQRLWTWTREMSQSWGLVNGNSLTYSSITRIMDEYKRGVCVYTQSMSIMAVWSVKWRVVLALSLSNQFIEKSDREGKISGEQFTIGESSLSFVHFQLLLTSESILNALWLPCILRTICYFIVEQTTTQGTAMHRVPQWFSKSLSEY